MKDIFKQYKHLGAAMAAFGCLVALPLQAAEELAEYVVTASSKVQENTVDAPASVTVIDKEKLDKTPATDLYDYLRHEASISVVGLESGKSDISIRGMSGEHTLILVDGKRQNTRETMNRGTSGVMSSFIPPKSAIERIEVVRGPMSSLYGADAMGGVINIITRKTPQSWSGQTRLGFNSQQNSELGDSSNASIWLSGPVVADKLGISVSGNYSLRDEDKVYYPNSKNSGSGEIENQRMALKATFAPVENHSFDFEVGEEGFTNKATPDVSLPKRVTGRDWLKDYKTRSFYSLDHKGVYSFGNSYLAAYNEESEREVTTINGKWPQKAKISNTVFEGKISMALGINYLTLGAQSIKSTLSNIRSESRPPRGYGQNTNKVDNELNSVFIENEAALGDSLLLTVGVRLDDDERYGEHISPRGYGVYHVNDKLALRGGVGTGFKAPKLRQTTKAYCMSTGRGRAIMCGNPDLKPETSLSQEVGFNYQFNQASNMEFVVFNTDLEDSTVSFDTGKLDSKTGRLVVYEYGNVAKANIHGAELKLALNPSDTLAISTNYSYIKSERKSDGVQRFRDGSSLKGQPLDVTPEHKLGIRADYRPLSAVNTYLAVNYTGKQYWAGMRNRAMNLRTRPASTTADIGVSYKFNANFAADLAVLNIADHRVPVDDRPSRAPIGKRLDGNWLIDDGRRINVGITAQF